MVISFSTNPYNNYFASDSKEFIALDKSAKQDFNPDKCFDLLPEYADAFAVEVEKYAKELVTIYCSMFQPHAKLMQRMLTFSFTQHQITCSKHGIG